MSITVFVMFAVILHNILNRFLQWLVAIFGCQRQDVSSVAKEIVSNLSIYLQALRNSHAQPCEHY